MCGASDIVAYGSSDLCCLESISNYHAFCEANNSNVVHIHRCCLDGQPHMLTVQDCNMLCNFAELVVREVEKKHVVRICSHFT